MKVRTSLRWRMHSLRFAAVDLRHTVYALVRLLGIDLLVVSGGGQIDEFWGGPWKHPYALFKWSVLARLTGVRIIFLSVGVGTVESRLSRWFLRQALSLAHYRSYRDSGSLKLVNDRLDVGFGDAVVPDMAFGLPGDNPWAATSNEPRTVAIGAMAYCDPRSWPIADSSRYKRYVDLLAGICKRLTRQGDHVVLFAGEVHHDRATIEEVLALTAAAETASAGTLTAPPTKSVPELIAVLRTADFVVASRFHGTLLALLLGRPVLAVSHERKVRQLMADFGLAELCVDIDEADLPTVLPLLDELRQNGNKIRNDVVRHAARAHREVLQQFDEVAARFIPDAVDQVRPMEGH